MQLSSGFILALTAFILGATADEHTSCWCESDASAKDPGGALSKDLTYQACIGYAASYPFYRQNKPFQSTSIRLTEDNYNGYSNGGGESYHWLCVAKENGLIRQVIGGNEWQKECINAARAKHPDQKNVRGKCPQPVQFPAAS